MRLGLCWLLLPLACSAQRVDSDAGTTPVDSGALGVDGGFAPDQGVSVDASGPRCEVGTGVDLFEAVTEDQVVALSLGPQGGGRYSGYHIWSSVRASGVSPQRALVRFKLLMADTRTEIGRQERQFNLEPNGENFVAYGVAPWIDDCCPVRNQPVLMQVELQDQNGLSCTDERRVRAADRCPDPNNNDICP